MIIRTIDNTGRICLPIQFRKALGLEKTGAIALEMHGNQVVLARFGASCCICGDTKNLREIASRQICECCLNELVEYERHKVKTTDFIMA